MPLVFLLAPTLTVAPWSLRVPGKYVHIVVEVDKIIGKGKLFLGDVALYVITLKSTNISVCVTYAIFRRFLRVSGQYFLS